MSQRALGRVVVRARLQAALLAIALVSGPGALIAGDSATLNRPPAHLEHLAETLDALRLAGNVPAMAAAVAMPGRPVAYLAFGRATPDTPFRWGSVTKSFTALAALRLVDDGRVALDSPVRPLLGDTYYENPWEGHRPLRLHHLLTLSTGFADLSQAEWDSNIPLPLWAALEQYAPARVVRWPPGLQHSYSNAPPALTAAVIERVAGVPFERFLTDQVLMPLGMPGATLSPIAGLPGGHGADGVTEIPYWHMTYPAFGALNASTRELGRLLTALLHEGRLPDAPGLPADLPARLLTVGGTLAADTGLEVGYGAGAYGWVRHGHVFWGHGGDADGYRSRYGVLPAHGRGYALVINTDNPRLLARLTRAVETFLVGDLPEHSPLPLVAEDLTPYVGAYHPSSARFDRTGWAAGSAERAEIRIAGGVLEFSHRGRTTPLHPLGGRRFARPGDPAVTVVFLWDRGSFYLQGELGNFVSLSQGSCPDFLAGCD